LTSDGKVEKNIRDGLKQLVERYATHERPASARGVLVLSIGGLLTSSLEPFQAQDSERLSQALTSIHHEFVRTYERHWTARRCDPRTVAIVIICNIVAVVNQRLTTAHHLAVEGQFNLSDADKLLVKHIAAHFEPAPVTYL